VSRIITADVKAMLAEESNGEPSPSAVRRHAIILGTILGAVADGRIARNPVRGVKASGSVHLLDHLGRWAGVRLSGPSRQSDPTAEVGGPAFDDAATGGDDRRERHLDVPI
jgi:hypothetical protein